MIPAPQHFNGIYRQACLHPDVEAEIEAARRRSTEPRPVRANIVAALLRRIDLRRPSEWSRVPAE